MDTRKRVLFMWALSDRGDIKMRSLVLSLVLFTNFALAYQIEINGKVISTQTEVRVESCDDFEVHFISEKFPKFYENHLNPESGLGFNFIPGFYGSSLYASHIAIIVPGGIHIPRANDIELLSELKKHKRTYLPFSVKCENKKISVQYWSGGNCDYCETFVEFRLKNGKLLLNHGTY